MTGFTRRKFGEIALKSAVISAMPISGLILGSSAHAADNKSYALKAAKLVERTPDNWLHQYKSETEKKKALRGPLDMRRFKDPVYVLMASIGWYSATDNDIAPLVVPKGFVTDFASLPSVFWSLFRPDGSFAYVAILHDYLYWQQERPIDEANNIFRLALTDLKINDFQKVTLFEAVNKSGAFAWAKNAELISKGEKRVLAILPADSGLTWEEYKTRPDVFI